MKDINRLVVLVYGLFIGYFLFDFLVKIGINGYIGSNLIVEKEPYFQIFDLFHFLFIACMLFLIKQKHRWMVSITGLFITVFSFLSFVEVVIKIINLQNYKVDVGQKELVIISKSLEQLYFLHVPYLLLLFSVGIFLLFIESATKKS